MGRAKEGSETRFGLSLASVYFHSATMYSRKSSSIGSKRTPAPHWRHPPNLCEKTSDRGLVVLMQPAVQETYADDREGTDEVPVVVLLDVMKAYARTEPVRLCQRVRSFGGDASRAHKCAIKGEGGALRCSTSQLRHPPRLLAGLTALHHSSGDPSAHDQQRRIALRGRQFMARLGRKSRSQRSLMTQWYTCVKRKWPRAYSRASQALKRCGLELGAAKRKHQGTACTRHAEHDIGREQSQVTQRGSASRHTVHGPIQCGGRTDDPGTGGPAEAVPLIPQAQHERMEAQDEPRLALLSAWTVSPGVRFGAGRDQRAGTATGDNLDASGRRPVRTMLDIPAE
ncbi:hypothetical protein PybrP1_005686, partial [[Pythium] brassicae (nom. inval.)]